VGILICALVIWQALHPAPTPKPGPVTPAPAPVVVVTPPPVINKGTPAPGPVVAVVTPAPATPKWQDFFPVQGNATPVPNPTPNPGPATPPPEVTPNPPSGPLVDPKLVGTWTTKVTSKSGFVTMKWEQLDDGRYSLLRGGVAVDTGTLTAREGNIHQVSTATSASSDIPYEFKSNSKVQTTGLADPGPITWTRSSSGSSSTKEKSGESAHSRNRGGNGGESGPHFNIPEGLRHIPLPHGFHF